MGFTALSTVHTYGYGYQDDVLPLYPFFMGPKEPMKQ